MSITSQNTRDLTFIDYKIRVFRENDPSLYLVILHRLPETEMFDKNLPLTHFLVGIEICFR